MTRFARLIALGAALGLLGASAATPVDRSLRTAEYVALGVPSPDDAWSGAQLQQAVRVLQDVAKDDPAQLPHYDSPTSGELFARVSSREGLAALQNRERSLLERHKDVQARLESLQALLGLYGAAIQASGASAQSSADFLEIYGALLHTLAAYAPLSEEPLILGGEIQPSSDSVLKLIRLGFERTLATAPKLLADEGLPAQNRRRLLDTLRETLPVLMPRIPEAAQRELVERLRALAAEGRQSLGSELDRLLEATER